MDLQVVNLNGVNIITYEGLDIISHQPILSPSSETFSIHLGVWNPVVIITETGYVLLEMMDNLWIKDVHGQLEVDQTILNKNIFDIGGQTPDLYDEINLNSNLSNFLDDYVSNPQVTIYGYENKLYYLANIQPRTFYSILGYQRSDINPLDKSQLPNSPNSSYYLIYNRTKSAILQVEPLAGNVLKQVTFSPGDIHAEEIDNIGLPQSLIPFDRQLIWYPPIPSQPLVDKMVQLAQFLRSRNEYVWSEELLLITGLYFEPGSNIPLTYSNDQWTDLYGTLIEPTLGMRFLTTDLSPDIHVQLIVVDHGYIRGLSVNQNGTHYSVQISMSLRNPTGQNAVYPLKPVLVSAYVLFQRALIKDKRTFVFEMKSLIRNLYYIT